MAKIPTPQPRGRRGSLFQERLRLVSPELAFVGDSILAKFTEPGSGEPSWEKHYSPLNSGNLAAVGDSTQMLIEKLEKDMLPLQDTRIVVLNIGSTDIRKKLKSGIVFEQIRKIVRLLQAACRPGVKILVLGILANVDCNPEIAETNDHLSTLENGFTVRYISLEPLFFDKEKGVKDELFHNDKIHLSPAGYEVLASAIHPVLQECLEDSK